MPESYLGIGAALWPALGIVTFLAGLLRGFSGFGSSLLMVPALGFLLGPVAAVSIATLLEAAANMLLFVPALRSGNARTLAAMAVAASLAIPFGHAALTYADPAFSNLLISLLVAGMGVWLTGAGRRLSFPAGRLGQVFAGGLSGLLTGFGGIGGPPLVLYILSGSGSAGIKRANLILVSGIALVSAVVSMHWFGLLNVTAMVGGLILAPAFMIGNLVGIRLFGIAPEQVYQRVALTSLVALSLLIFVVNLVRITV